jgi:tetratricopeptide (TPR) repeat protein
MASGASREDSLRLRAHRSSSIAEKIDAYLALSKEFIKSNLDSSVFYGMKSLSMADGEKDKIPFAEVFAVMGDIMVKRNDLSKALMYYDQAVRLYTEAQKYKEVIKIMVVQGNIYLVQENVPEALDKYLQGVALSEQHNDKSSLGNLYNNIGIIYFQTNEKKDALDYYSRANKIFEENKDSMNVIISLGNIGSIYMDLGKMDIARSYFETALELSKKIKAFPQEANALQQLGLLSDKEGDYRNAMEFYQRALEIYKSNELKESAPPSIFYSNIYTNIGNTYFKTGDNPRAIDYLKKGFTLAEQTQSYSVMSNASLFLSRAYQDMENYKAAFLNYQLYKQFNDSANNVPGLQKLIRMQMKFQMDKRIKEQELQQKVQILRQKRLQLLYIGLFVIALMAAILMFLLFRLQKNKIRNVELEQKNLQNELEFKNKELMTNIMYLLKKNEFIITISEKLRKVNLEQNPGLEPMIREVIHELETGSSPEKWKEFEMRFQDVHKDFYRKLNEKHPDLTTNDLRMCAFIRLNMNTKEIAAVTYQSVNSIVVARSRLKQKLKLSKDDSLTAYISGF